MSAELEIVRAHVLRGRRLVREQRERIALLETKGKSTALSRDVLKNFEEALRIFEADLDYMEREARSRDGKSL